MVAAVLCGHLGFHGSRQAGKAAGGQADHLRGCLRFSAGGKKLKDMIKSTVKGFRMAWQRPLEG